ncbi:MAG TPA: hypothetical protein VFA27_16280 [Vicinamibacterales bacterium]|nr:hypothetical protein [Vicinamibacterales bacterium]
MSTAFVWLAIGSSVSMGLAGVCLFVFAVRHGYFTDFESAKYHVFWSDLQDESTAISEERQGGPDR